MANARTVLNQVNIVCGDLDASIEFYRRLGVEIPHDAVWRTDSGAHHVNATAGDAGGRTLEIDSAAFAPHWNAGWRGRGDLAGRVVVGLSVPTREDVDRLYAEVTSASQPAAALGCLLGCALCDRRGSRRGGGGADEPRLRRQALGAA